MSLLKELILAALFQNIGRFAKRAGENDAANLLFLPREIDGNAADNLLDNSAKTEDEILAAECLTAAVGLALGVEDEIKENDSPEYLTSIFEEVSLKKREFNKDSVKTYPLETIDKNPYPQKPGHKKKATEAQRKLWEAFSGEIKNNEVFKNPEIPFRHYLNTLLTLMEKYLWCAPTITDNSLPNVSLYDHACLTAAIAQALYKYYQTYPEAVSPSNRDAKKFILLGGGLSGIQSYIFELNKSHSAGVGKLFRARSFYLQALAKAAVLDLLESLGLYSVSRIMDIGGKFILLLPNTEEATSKIQSWKQKLEKEFVANFKGIISLNTCDLEISKNDLALENFNSTLDGFFDELEKSKLNKFSSYMDDENFSPVISQNYSDEYDGNCQICEKNRADAEKSKQFGKLEDIKICGDCHDQIEILGTRLAMVEKFPYFKFFTSSRKQEKSVSLILGWKIAFTGEPDKEDQKAELVCNRKEHKDYAFHPLAGHIPLIDQEDIDYWKKQKAYTALKETEGEIEAGNPKTFTMIAHSRLQEEEENEEATGVKHLGVFKADVDNLGFAFFIGFKKKRKLSISRFAGFSRMLNHFFAVTLLQLIKKEAPNVYVIFAGGDDLFFLGPWVEVVHFAGKLEKEFKRFTAGNPDLNLSAGVGVFGSSLPIKDIARMTEELLESSKKFDGKNAVSLFGDTVNWDEFEELLKRGKELSRFQRGKVLSSGFVYRLLDYSREKKKFDEGDIKAGLYISHMSYDFARNIPPEKFTANGFSEKDYQNFVSNWKDTGEYLKNPVIPLHYSLYRNRK